MGETESLPERTFVDMFGKRMFVPSVRVQARPSADWEYSTRWPGLSSSRGAFFQLRKKPPAGVVAPPRGRQRGRRDLAESTTFSESVR